MPNRTEEAIEYLRGKGLRVKESRLLVNMWQSDDIWGSTSHVGPGIVESFARSRGWSPKEGEERTVTGKESDSEI